VIHQTAMRKESRSDHRSISDFVSPLFGSLPRTDQRRWAHFYVRGLLATRERKSIRNISGGAWDTATAQSLQQFVNQSPWKWEPARAILAETVWRHITPLAWVFDRIAIPKRGAHSVGVARRFAPECGRTVNSQLGVGLFLADRRVSIPVDWRIVLDGRWASDPALRAKCRVPSEVPAACADGSVLSLLEAQPAGPPPGPLLGDVGGSGDAGRFLRELARRQVAFLLRVDGSQKAVGSRSQPAGQHPVTTVEDLTQRLSRQCGLRPLSAADSRGPQVLSSLVQLSGSAPPAGHAWGETVQRLVLERPLDRPGTPQYWLTNLRRNRLGEIPDLLQVYGRHREEAALLRSEFGVLDFEGRSYPGWHHHMTLVSAAFAYDRLVGRTAARPAVPGRTGTVPAPRRHTESTGTPCPGATRACL
jgi:DDE superfamily endonuclease